MDFPDYVYEIQDMVPDEYSEALDSMRGPYELPHFYETLGRERFLGVFLGENDHLTDMENIYLEQEKLTDGELEHLTSPESLETDLEKPELNETEIVHPRLVGRYSSVPKIMGAQFSRLLPFVIGGGIASDFLINHPPEVHPIADWLPGILLGTAAGGLYTLYHFKKKELKIREENTAQASDHILGTLWGTRVYVSDEKARAALKSNQHVYPLSGVLEELESTLEEEYSFMDGLLYVDTADSDDEILYGREVWQICG